MDEKPTLFVFVQRLMGSFKALWTFFCTAKLKKKKDSLPNLSQQWC